MKKTIFIICLLLAPLSSKADLFGGDLVFLSQILMQTITQVHTMMEVLGKASDTVGILEEMNRGVKEVLHLAETAHIPLPAQVYASAKQIDQATETARRLYGPINGNSPSFTQTNYKSGVEGLSLSEDTFDYSTLLDDQGNKVKSASLIASQATATRLTAETLGVILHAVSHGNRIEAKQLELTSSRRLEDSSKENAQYESFVATQDSINVDMKTRSFNSLNDVSSGED